MCLFACCLEKVYHQIFASSVLFHERACVFLILFAYFDLCCCFSYLNYGLWNDTSVLPMLNVSADTSCGHDFRVT